MPIQIIEDTRIMHSLYRLGQNKKLIDAAANGDVRKIKKALSHGAEINAKDNGDWTKKIYLSIPKELKGLTALMNASAGGKTAAVVFLLEKGANVNATNDNGQTALFGASAAGHSKVVRALLEHSADLEARDEFGNNALFYAYQSGDAETIDIIKAEGRYATEISESIKRGQEALGRLRRVL